MAKLSAWSRNKAQELRASVARTHFASSIVHICEEDLTSQLSLYFIYLFIFVLPNFIIDVFLLTFIVSYTTRPDWLCYMRVA